MPAVGAVLGIDVGCSAARASSAVCWLGWNEARARWRVARVRGAEPEREQAIHRIAGSGPLSAVAIDGSLRRRFDAIGRYRSCERLLTRRLGTMIGKPGQSSTPVGRLLNHHANLCARAALTLPVARASHGEAIDARAIIEAFPSSFLGGMLEPGERAGTTRGTRSDVYFIRVATCGGFAALLAAMLPGRALAGDPAGITDHDERAAFVCALTALCLAAGRYTAAGDDRDGWIILPPRPFLRDDVASALAANAAEDETGTVRFHD